MVQPAVAVPAAVPAPVVLARPNLRRALPPAPRTPVPPLKQFILFIVLLTVTAIAIAIAVTGATAIH
jgi:hypothetical protein